MHDSSVTSREPVLPEAIDRRYHARDRVIVVNAPAINSAVFFETTQAPLRTLFSDYSLPRQFETRLDSARASLARTDRALRGGVLRRSAASLVVGMPLQINRACDLFDEREAACALRALTSFQALVGAGGSGLASASPSHLLQHRAHPLELTEGSLPEATERRCAQLHIPSYRECIALQASFSPTAWLKRRR